MTLAFKWAMTTLAGSFVKVKETDPSTIFGKGQQKMICQHRCCWGSISLSRNLNLPLHQAHHPEAGGPCLPMTEDFMDLDLGLAWKRALRAVVTE